MSKYLSNPRYIIAHGKRIWVETLDMPDGPAGKTKLKDFRLLQLEWAAGATKAAKTPGAMVLILLSYMVWKTKSTTFSLSNVLLAQYGVHRKTKYRILANLEKAGWIKIQHRNKQSPVVTLLVMPK